MKQHYVRKRTLLIMLALMLVMALLALAACAPKQEVVSDGQASSTESANLESMGYSKFTERDAGFVGDNFYTTDFINAGNRGCNACHEDLWDVAGNLSPVLHLASSDPGYGYNANAIDCIACHAGVGLAGTSWKDSIHAVHMSNSTFVEDLDGNCMSCHAIDKSGNFVLWELYRISAQYGGWQNAADPGTTDWLARRDWNKDTTADTQAGITLQSDMPIAVNELKQETSAVEDRFSACNYGVIEINEADWKLEVKGVVNERSFTLEELKALPSTERTLLQACNANAVGSYQVSNIPVKGVLLSDVIEACGGLKDGMSSVLPSSQDNWSMTGDQPASLDWLMPNDPLIIYEEYGEPLSSLNGFPATFGMPGLGCGTWTKWLTSIEFMPDAGLNYMDMIGGTNNVPQFQGDIVDTAEALQGWFNRSSVNSMWMNPVNHGDVLKMGEDGTVDLGGVAYSWASNGSHLSQIAFSADYGTTWTTVDVPENLDPYQWVNWSAKWTPDGPGTYVLYMSSVDATLGWQNIPSAITVVVE